MFKSIIVSLIEVVRVIALPASFVQSLQTLRRARHYLAYRIFDMPRASVFEKYYFHHYSSRKHTDYTNII